MGTMTNTYGSLKEYVRDTAGKDRVDTFTDRLLARAVQNGLERATLARDWEHLRDRFVLATTVPDGTSITGNNCTATFGSKTVATVDADAAWIGGWIRVDSGPEMYEITGASTGVSLTLRDAFRGPTATTTYEILFPYVTLPDNCNTVYSIVDTARKVPMAYARGESMYWLNVANPSEGQPSSYDIQTKRGGATKELWLWPIPGDEVWRYEVIYYRYAGWWNTSTSAFTNNNDPGVNIEDDYVADWPNQYLSLLRASCLMSAYEEHDDPRYQQANMRFHQELARCSQNDHPASPVAVLGTQINRYPSDYGRIKYP